MSYFVSAFKRDETFVYRVWSSDEQEYSPEMNEIEISDWTKALVRDVEEGMSNRLVRARDRGTSGVFDVGLDDEPRS